MGASIATGISYIIFFWLRTLISRKLWFKFDIKLYLINTILMLILSFSSVVINNFYVNLSIVILIIFIDRLYIFKIYEIVKPLVFKLK